jgi:hypothetical protein
MRNTTLLQSLSLLACFFSLSGCSRDPLLSRTAANYFPLAVTNTWTYKNVRTGDTTTTLRVADTTNILARECWILERNGIPEYWWKDEERIDKYFCETVFMNGTEDTVAAFWIPWLYTPPVLNESWRHDFQQEKPMLGDTIRTTFRVRSEIARLKDEEYLLEVQIIRTRDSNSFGSCRDTLTYREWYAGNIGVVDREFGDSHEKLVSYSLD